MKLLVNLILILALFSSLVYAIQWENKLAQTTIVTDFKIEKYDNLELLKYKIVRDVNDTLCFEPRNQTGLPLTIDVQVTTKDDKNKTVIKIDKIDKKKDKKGEKDIYCLDKTKYKKGDKLQIGEFSIKMVKIDQTDKTTEFIFDWGVCYQTLQLRNGIKPQGLFVIWDGHHLKTGGYYPPLAKLNITGEFTYLFNCTTNISTFEMSGINETAYPKIYVARDNIIHDFDYKDICNKTYSKCKWTNQGLTGFEINFTSGWKIDPTYQNISACATPLTSNMYYTMNASASSAYTCMNLLSVQNSTFDCQGNTITYCSGGYGGTCTYSTGYGIIMGGNNNTIKNCIIKTARAYPAISSYGIYFTGNNHSIINTSLSNGLYDIYIAASRGINFTNISINSSNAVAIYMSIVYNSVFDDIKTMGLQQQGIYGTGVYNLNFSNLNIGRNLTASQSYQALYFTTGSNISIKNLQSTNFQSGVLFYTIDNATVYNSTLTNVSASPVYVVRSDSRSCVNKSGGLTGCSDLTSYYSCAPYYGAGCNTNCTGTIGSNCDAQTDSTACTTGSNGKCLWNESCTGAINFECNDLTDDGQTTCESYSGWMGQCAWQSATYCQSGNGYSCGNWDYYSCPTSYGCTQQPDTCYGSGNSCGSYSAGSCPSGCSDYYYCDGTLNIDCSTWNNDQYSCDTTYGAACSFTAAYCYGSLSNYCSNYNGDSANCDGTYGDICTYNYGDDTCNQDQYDCANVQAGNCGNFASWGCSYSASVCSSDGNSCNGIGYADCNTYGGYGCTAYATCSGSLDCASYSGSANDCTNYGCQWQSQYCGGSYIDCSTVAMGYCATYGCYDGLSYCMETDASPIQCSDLASSYSACTDMLTGCTYDAQCDDNGLTDCNQINPNGYCGVYGCSFSCFGSLAPTANCSTLNGNDYYCNVETSAKCEAAYVNFKTTKVYNVTSDKTNIAGDGTEVFKYWYYRATVNPIMAVSIFAYDKSAVLQTTIPTDGTTGVSAWTAILAEYKNYTATTNYSNYTFYLTTYKTFNHTYAVTQNIDDTWSDLIDYVKKKLVITKNAVMKILKNGKVIIKK